MNSLLLAGFAETFKTIIGVILALAGLGILLMGTIALSDKAWRSGGHAILASKSRPIAVSACPVA